MRLEEYDRTLSITYEEYCFILDNLYSVNEIDLLRPLREFSTLVKTTIIEISKNFKLGVDVLVKAFKDRHIYNTLKAFGFNFILILKSLRAITGLLSGGLRAVMNEIVDTKLFQEIKNGTVKIDDLLETHPILKRLVGVPLAGLIFYISLHIPCIGDFHFDFDFQDIFDALKGTYKVTDIFANADALINVALLLTGTWVSMNFPWLSKDVYTILVGVVYTAFRNTDQANLAMLFEPVIDWV